MFPLSVGIRQILGVVLLLNRLRDRRSRLPIVIDWTLEVYLNPSTSPLWERHMKKNYWAAAITIAAAIVFMGYGLYKELSDDFEIDWDNLEL